MSKGQRQLLLLGATRTQGEVYARGAAFSGDYAAVPLRTLCETLELRVTPFALFPHSAPNVFTAAALATKALWMYKPDIVVACGPLVAQALGVIASTREFDSAVGHWSKITHEDRAIFVLLVPELQNVRVDVQYGAIFATWADKVLRFVRRGLAYDALTLHDDAGWAEAERDIKACVAAKKPISIDIETRPVIKDSKDLTITSIGWSWRDGEGWAVSADQAGSAMFRDFVTRVLGPVLVSSDVAKIGHNFAFDDFVLRRVFGLALRGPLWDTLALSNLHRPLWRKDLDTCAAVWLDVERWKGGHDSHGQELRKYNAKDAAVTLLLYRRLKDSMHESQRGYYAGYRAGLFQHVQDMACSGMLIDEIGRTEARETLARRITDIGASLAHFGNLLPPREVTKLKRNKVADVPVDCPPFAPGTKIAPALASLGITAGAAQARFCIDPKTGVLYRKAFREVVELKEVGHFNLRSAPQKKLILAALGVKLPASRKAKTKGESAGAAVLKKVLFKTEDARVREFGAGVLQFGKLVSFKKTYLDARLSPDGRYDFGYNMEGTITGRSSSSQTPFKTGGNSQNFPRSPREGFNFRSMVRAPAGFVLVAADQSSAESIVVAHRSKCQAMLAEFAKPLPDIHTLVARLLYARTTGGASFDALDKSARKEVRTSFKPITHGCSYMLGVETLQDYIFDMNGTVLTTKECRTLMESWHAAFPEIRLNWHKELAIELERRGWLMNAFGRRLDLRGGERDWRLPQVVAWEPQSTIPDCSNATIQGVCSTIAQGGPEARLVQMGHDSLLWEVRESDLASFLQLFSTVTNSIELDFDGAKAVIPWEVKTGLTWGEMELAV